MGKTYTYRIIIEPDERGTYHAFVPALPGCHTWGDSVDEARANIRDAMDAYVRSLAADRRAIPEDKGLGFFEHPERGTSHLVLVHSDGRRNTISRHAGREIPRGTLGAILRDINISPKEFVKLLKG